MAELHDKIIALLKANGINYEDNDRKLAKGIIHLVKTTNAQQLRDVLFTTKTMVKGTHCPLCSQNVKMYKKAIDANMAYCLIRLYHISHGDTSKYFHVQDDIGVEMKVGGSWAKLRFWNLIEEQPKDEGETHKRTIGMWRITQAGIDFVMGRSTHPKYAKLYNMNFYGHEGDGLTIRDALGNKFNYQELMRR